MKKAIIGVIIAVVVVGAGTIIYTNSHDKTDTKIATTTMDMSKSKDGSAKVQHTDSAAGTYENVTGTKTMDLSRSKDGTSKVTSSSAANLKQESDISKSNKFTPNGVIKSTNVLANLNKIIEAKYNSIIVPLSSETLGYISASDANRQDLLKKMQGEYSYKNIYVTYDTEIVPVTVDGEGAYAVLFRNMESMNQSTDYLMTIINNKGHIYTVNEIATLWSAGNLDLRALDSVKPYDTFFEDGYKGQSPEKFAKNGGKLENGSYVDFENNN